MDVSSMESGDGAFFHVLKQFKADDASSVQRGDGMAHT
jgi:hypothetical protein